jgi:hypothetical protein
MGVTWATPPTRPANEVQSRRPGKLLNAGSPPPRNASSVVPKCHKKAGFIAWLSCLWLPLSMQQAHDEYNWRPEIYIELNGPSTGRGNGATCKPDVTKQ